MVRTNYSFTWRNEPALKFQSYEKEQEAIELFESQRYIKDSTISRKFFKKDKDGELIERNGTIILSLDWCNRFNGVNTGYNGFSFALDYLKFWRKLTQKQKNRIKVKMGAVYVIDNKDKIMDNKSFLKFFLPEWYYTRNRFKWSEDKLNSIYNAQGFLVESPEWKNGQFVRENQIPYYPYVSKIQRWFLKRYYDPRNRMCIRRLDRQYDEYDSDNYIEGEYIMLVPSI